MVGLQRKRKPSAICERRRAVPASRSSWNGVRIASSDRIENADETASTRKGTARPSPNSAAPSGGPASRTVARCAPCTPTAVGSSRRGATARNAPVWAATKKVAPVPSTKATSATCQNATWSSRIVAARLASATARTPSATIISHLRFQRSAATPASSVNSAKGISRANATTPAFAGEWVTTRTSSG